MESLDSMRDRNYSLFFDNAYVDVYMGHRLIGKRLSLEKTECGPEIPCFKDRGYLYFGYLWPSYGSAVKNFGYYLITARIM